MAHIFYESVHRFPKLLEELSTFVGDDRVIVVGRELTKMHEEIFRGTVDAAQKHFGKENTKGEFVVTVAPKGWQQ
jgi:16S rRNA (cytidine1402-2'-O)-methyltransferase